MILQEDGHFSIDDIDKIKDIIISRNVTLNKYEKYLLGRNPTIVDKPETPSPDNRVPVPIGSRIVQIRKGYFAKPGNIRYTSPDSNYIERVKEIFDYNDEELKSSELYEMAAGLGYCFELLSYNMSGDIKQYVIDPRNGYMVRSEDLDMIPLGFAYYVYNIDTREETMTVYYKNDILTYKKDNSNQWVVAEQMLHPFGDVPAVEYVCNRYALPIYFNVISLIDELDKTISNSYANELERFAQSYLLMLKRFNNATDPDTGLTYMELLKDRRLFDGLGEGESITDVNQAIGFLTKPSRGQDAAEAADRYERLIYNMSMTADPNGENIGVSSGIALKLKLLPMEWATSGDEAYFSKGLQERLRLIGNVLFALENASPEMVTINFIRNIPVDVMALAEEAGALQGILSKETILEQFPASIVPNVADELDRLEQTPSLQDNTVA